MVPRSHYVISYTLRPFLETLVPWSLGSDARQIYTATMKDKQINVRLDAELYDEIQKIVAVKGMTVTTFTRFALAQQIHREKASPEFQRKLDWHLNRIGGLKD